ncbi:glycosyl hydrolase family 71-domain-containing protein [Mycena leptocephala]|nr:glycosyl hydrolase family 71-domain-containing protein [Mycena leptocephala]
MHHVRPLWPQTIFSDHGEVDCRQYHYTLDTWKDDIAQIAARDDAIALNIGGDSWQMTQVASAYAAAQALNSRRSSLLVRLHDLAVVRPGGYYEPGEAVLGPRVAVQSRRKPMISSYSGDCLGNDQTGGYLMPYPSMDSWYCWGCAWPQGNYDKNTDDDNYYISQLGTKYATTVSMWFFTHLSDKNRLLRSDDWLLNSRWEQLMTMRNTLTFVEMVTWNDFGESDYFGPVRVDQPAGTTWADGYPHTAWFDMSAYYIQAFKTGVYPAITQDVIYYWARPHPHDAIVSGDGTRPDNWDWTQDYLWVAAFCSSTCTVTLKVGSSTGTFTNQPAGVNKLKIPGICGGGNRINIYYAAKGLSTTTSSTTTTTTTTTTSTSTSAAATSSPTWSYLGCYVDTTNPRTLDKGIHYSSPSGQSVKSCLAACAAAGFLYGGTEYGVRI